jgi:hypothetical protein
MVEPGGHGWMKQTTCSHETRLKRGRLEPCAVADRAGPQLMAPPEYGRVGAGINHFARLARRCSGGRRRRGTNLLGTRFDL